MKRYIWRVEDQKGVGPYSHPNTPLAWRPWWADYRHDFDTGHPTPEEDLYVWGFRAVDKTYKYGFRTLKQLHEWFSDNELQRLTEAGYRIVRRRAKKVYLGTKQVAYK